MAKHRIDDERRTYPDGKAYPPFHDVQILVDGAAAATLGELAQERWHRATLAYVSLWRDIAALLA